ncbi:MAG: thioredoxin [Bacteroidales bacterium]|nr:thioredoxin [Bacteroidales bacterium]
MSLSAKEITQATDQTFASEIKEGYVLVDFWATWCPPCRALAPIFAELSQEFSGEVKFVKLDVDRAGKTATQYGIRSIPTLILFKDGKQIEKWIGGRSKEDLRILIKEAIR